MVVRDKTIDMVVPLLKAMAVQSGSMQSVKETIHMDFLDLKDTAAQPSF